MNMTTEEKAIAYDKALERAKLAIKECGNNKGRISMIESIFPILSESEDEKIRKRIIHALHGDVLDMEETNKAIAWLEKQEGCKQKNKINSYKITFEDVLALECAMKTVKITEGGDKLYEILVPLYNKIHNAYLAEKQDEKKSTEAKPKFNVGDWIYSNNVHEDYRICKIVKIEDNKYYIESVYGYRGYNTFETFEKDYNLWTIDDAKDGDVLTNGEIILIFKHFEEPAYMEHIIAYIGLDISRNIQVTDGYWQLGVKASPATKEQCDLLFQKMKEVGYGWDADKKELEKINSYCQENCKGYQETGKCFADGGCDAKHKAEQKSTAWSEEDEKAFEDLIGYLNFEGQLDSSKFIVSLRDRLKGGK